MADGTCNSTTNVAVKYLHIYVYFLSLVFDAVLRKNSQKNISAENNLGKQRATWIIVYGSTDLNEKQANKPGMANIYILYIKL